MPHTVFYTGKTRITGGRDGAGRNSPGNTTIKRTALAALAAGLMAAASPTLAHELAKPTPFLPSQNEPPPTLRVEPPLAEPLAQRGAVIIPYRLTNFRILPIFGAAAAGVSPRAGHLHVTVDDLPWHWADVGAADTVVVVGLPAGPHKILIEIATPEHRVIAGQAVEFVIPTLQPAPHAGH